MAQFATSKGSRIALRVVLYTCLIATLGYAGVCVSGMLSTDEGLRQTEERTVSSAGLVAPAPKTLASTFTDSLGRLLADPPTSPDKLSDPDTLIVAHIEGSEESPGTSWDVFKSHLAQVTGKKVADITYDNSSDQLAQIADGKITIVAIHPADAPFLVNNYGFQPIAVLADNSGINGNHLDIIVPAGSSIATPADLKGHTLVCTTPTSITGYRAAIALLMQNQSLRPNVDYYISWSMGQKRSITGIADGKFEAAAVSDDKLQSMVADGSVDKSKYKLIYASDVIPRTTIGYFYNLKPALAGKVSEAILTFKPAAAPSTQPAEADVAVNPALHFIPIDYKKDFQLVRTIDDNFDPRLDVAKKQKLAAN